MKFKKMVTYEAIEDGMPIPKWHLPLYRDWNMRTVICYPILIWPFAVVWMLMYRITRHIAHDVHDVLVEFDWLERARERRKERDRRRKDEGEPKVGRRPY